MRRRAVKVVDEERGGGGVCPGVVGGVHVLSQSACLKHVRQGSEGVSCYNGRGKLHQAC